MNNQWYYGRGTDITGPVSGAELSNLAASGEVLRTDTIWREGIEDGVSAEDVKNLFQPVAELAPVDIALQEVDFVNLGLEPLTEDTSASVAVDVIAESISTVVVPPPAEPDPAIPAGTRPMSARPARATAGKGAVLVGQDGKTVKFRGKCSTCGREDTSYKSIAIPRGLTRSSFYCAKCRKRRDVEIHGTV
jgi:hypothetical protein